MNNHELQTTQARSVLSTIHHNWGWFLALGITLVTLGTLAIIFAFISTLISVVYLGVLLIIAGLLESIKASKLRHASHFLLHVGLGVLYIIGGFFLIMYPMVNALTLTLLLAIFFVASGIVKLIFAFRKNLPHRGWVITNGIITLLLGILIWYQWPVSGLWVLGTFIGIDMIFTGWSWIMLALMAKRVHLNNR